jgi:hypothetical protein
MARYCRTDGCPRSEHPLPKDGGPCPACGSVKHRLDPDVGVVTCRECDEPNESTADACWNCGAAFETGRMIGMDT